MLGFIITGSIQDDLERLRLIKASHNGSQRVGHASPIFCPLMVVEAADRGENMM